MINIKFVAALLLTLFAGPAEAQLSTTGAGLAKPGSSAFLGPGPNLSLWQQHPYYACTSNRYVSTTGSSGNSGLDAGHPWDISTALAYAAPAGTCINVAAGTYTFATKGGSSAVISDGGTSSSISGYVVWRCSTMPFSFSAGSLQGEGAGCVWAKGSGNADATFVEFNSNYVMFDGFEIIGEPSQTPGNGDSCFSNQFNGNGSGTITPTHHIWLLNSDIHGCGQSGVQWWGQDWAFFIHNVWHDNAFSSCAMGSGLSIYEPMGLNGYSPTPGNPDYWHSATTGITYHYVINHNVGYHNYNPPGNTPPTFPLCTTGNTDGEGIILDDWAHAQTACPAGSGFTCPYPSTGSGLVMGNVMYYNGGVGILQFSGVSGTSSAPKITVVNNTVYSNQWDPNNPNTTFRGNMTTNTVWNVTWINNISQAVQTSSPAGATNSTYVSGGATSPSGDTWTTNLAYPGSLTEFDDTNTYPTVGTNHNLDGSDPKFTQLTPNSSTGNNFALQGSSPAIGFGQAFDLWEQNGSIDAGACPHTFGACP